MSYDNALVRHTVQLYLDEAAEGREWAIYSALAGLYPAELYSVRSAPTPVLEAYVRCVEAELAAMPRQTRLREQLLLAAAKRWDSVPESFVARHIISLLELERRL